MYDKLPQSIKEGIIDLCYNKGQHAVDKVKNDIISAANDEDWSEIIKKT